MISSPLLDELEGLCDGPNIDLSDTIAQIHISCMLLELHEPGYWWDFDLVGMRLRHLAVINWMEHYGFAKMADLTAPALIAFHQSLKRRLDELDRGRLDAG